MAADGGIVDANRNSYFTDAPVLFSNRITVTEEANVLRITVEGKFGLWRNIRTLQRITREAKRRRAARILIDMRRIVGSMNNVERYELGAAAAAYKDLRFALLGREDQVNYFGEWIARSHGVDARVFIGEADALAWLARS